MRISGPGIQIPAAGINKLSQQIALKEGQVVKAEVVSLKGEQVKLKIGNTIIDAKTTVDLKTGANLNLLVESMKNNIIKLKIMPQGESVRLESILLSRMGMNPNSKMESMVHELLKFKMPLNPEVLKELASFTRLHNLPKETIPLLMWLKSSGINVQSKEDVELLLNLHRFFTGEDSKENENKFFNFLNKTESIVLGGHNIYGWPLGENRLYLLTNNSKNEKQEAGNCTLVVKTVSQHFDDLWFKINLKNTSLEITLHCDSDEKKKILEEEIVFLEKNLSQAGYNINAIRVETESINSIFDVITNDKKEILGVNYKV